MGQQQKMRNKDVVARTVKRMDHGKITGNCGFFGRKCSYDLLYSKIAFCSTLR